MKLEERGLSPIFSYINARLTKRPLHTGIWTTLMLIILASILKLDADRGNMGDALIFVVSLYAFIVVIALISTAIRAEGRRWLLERYEDRESGSVSAGSRIFVRLLPLVGLIVIGEYLLLR